MKMVVLLSLVAFATIAQGQTMNVGVGATTNKHGSFNLGFDLNLPLSENVNVRITPEFITMVPHTTLGTFWGGRAGIAYKRIACQGGYYFNEVSADKNEYTKGKNYWLPGGFVSYDLIRGTFGLTLQAGYLHEPQVLLTSKIDLF